MSMGHWSMQQVQLSPALDVMSLVLPEDYGQLCAQQLGTKTSRDDVNKAN